MKGSSIHVMCNLCDYQATMKGNLKQHIQSEHEDIKYSCDQYNYQFRKKISLLEHNEVEHTGIM